MITPEQALGLIRSDPVAGARLLSRFAAEAEAVNAQKVLITAMQADIATLRAEVQRLRDQLAKNSSNSSKPPSSDGLNKPKPKSLRPRGKRKPGGQKGHKGHTLRMVEKPDHTVPHAVVQCECCGLPLAEQETEGVEKRQVFDIPEPKVETTEHRAEIKTCACGHVNKAAFPPDVNAPVQYGPRIRAVATYLKDYQLLPYERLGEIMRELLGCPSFSEGTLANITGECAARLEQTDEMLRELAARAQLAGFDETGVRAEGALRWVHSVSTDYLTWYFPHAKRGNTGMDEAGVLPNFQGRAVHDFWKAYLNYDCLHAFCNAHLLRELTFLWEQQQQRWAKDMIDLLLEIKDATEAAVNADLCTLLPADLDRFQARYFHIVIDGLDKNPFQKRAPGKRRGRAKQSKAWNLLNRFREYAGEILAFMYDFSVPFDNNLSERDLRMIKVKQKISGTIRSSAGLLGFCRIRSYVSTARKNGLSALQALQRVFEGTPFLPSIART